MTGNSEVQSLPDTKYNTHRRLPVFTHGRCLEIVDQFSITTYAFGIKKKKMWFYMQRKLQTIAQVFIYNQQGEDEIKITPEKLHCVS